MKSGSFIKRDRRMNRAIYQSAFAALLLILGTAIPVLSQGVDERLQRLEEEVARLKTEREALPKNPMAWLYRIERLCGPERTAAFNSFLLHPRESSRSLAEGKTAPKVEQLPSVEPIPVTVGIYYSPEFLSDQRALSSPNSWPRPNKCSGQASQILFDHIFPILFENVIPIPTRPPGGLGGQKVAGVIEPQIDTIRNSFGTYISYRFVLYSPEGEPLASWSVTGSCRSPTVACAMREVGTKLLSNFRDFNGVANWLRASGVADDR